MFQENAARLKPFLQSIQKNDVECFYVLNTEPSRLHKKIEAEKAGML